MRIVTLIVALCIWAGPAYAQPGCIGGVIDYKTYVLSHLLNAFEGAPAVGWPEKLAASGLPVPLPNTPTNLAIHHGITQSIGDGGPRARVWTPTVVPEIDENGQRWYTHTIDIVNHDTQTWMWLDRGGNPPLVIKCGVTQPEPPAPPIPPSIPPSGDIDKLILTEVQALRLEEALRWQQVQKTYAQLVGGIFKFLGKYILPIVGGYLISDQLTK